MKRKLGLVFTLLALVGLAIGGAIYFPFGKGQQAPLYGPVLTSELTSELEKAGFGIVGTPVVSGSSVTATVSGKTVIFSRQKDFGSQVRALQLVLSRPTIGEEAPKKIDLRFNKVVVTYSHEE